MDKIIYDYEARRREHNEARRRELEGESMTARLVLRAFTFQVMHRIKNRNNL